MVKVMSNMYKNPSVGNKVHLINILFNLEIAEGASVVEYLNKFNTIVNSMVSVDIKFDDEVCAQILLALLLNIWEPTSVAVSNFIGNAKMKNIRDIILAKKVRRRDFG